MLWIDMDKATLRPLVLEVLRKTPQTHLHAIETEIRKRTDEYERHDALALQEILWELLVQGVLAPGKNSLNLNLPFVHVTEFGAACLEGGPTLVHDPDGYLRHLEEGCGRGVDPDLIDTTREAVLAYLAGRYPSSAVMLGRAAETLLDRLADALSCQEEKAGRSAEHSDDARSDTDRLVVAARRALASRRSDAHAADDAEAHLRELHELTDIHPTGRRSALPRADRDTALARLLLFAGQCRFVYDLIAHLEGEPPA